jgi:fluoroacetyl-CoA thioesterase
MLDIDQSLEFDYTVRDSDLAKNLRIDPGDSFPEVLATSRMIALMELAAARLMRGELQDGELSVGVGLNVTHTAATLCGEAVRVRATFRGMEGKFFRFAVGLFDGAGPAGGGEHTRAIIRLDRLLDGARKRAQRRP